MRRLVIIAALLAGCGDNRPATVTPPKDSGVTPDTPTPDAPPGMVGPCLDQPTTLERPPATALPCELLPPGFVQR
jgi:hypothetical protein